MLSRLHVLLVGVLIFTEDAMIKFRGVSIWKLRSLKFSSIPQRSEDTDEVFKVSSMVLGVVGCSE